VSTGEREVSATPPVGHGTGDRPVQPTIAFIGLGVMGAPMARRLVDAGYPVVAYSRTPAGVERLVEHGAQGATSAREAVAAASIVMTMLPDSPDVEEVALGARGFLEVAEPGTVHVDLSSIAPASAVRIAEAAAARGVRALDAPVSGGEVGAIAGTLSIMVGGDEGALEEVRGALEVLGKTIVHVGPPGAGQTVKAANQLIVAGTIQLVAEALVFLDAHGVELGAAVEVLAGGLAGNRILDLKAEGMLAHEFDPGFRIDLHHKDLGNLLRAAREAGVPLPLGSSVADILVTARAQGLGHLDHSALLLTMERLAGRVVAQG
jgi:2-hydroxy-3-oxopropionate reductase